MPNANTIYGLNFGQYLKLIERYWYRSDINLLVLTIVRNSNLFDNKNGLESTIKLMPYVFSAPDNLCVTSLLSFMGLSPWKVHQWVISPCHLLSFLQRFLRLLRKETPAGSLLTFVPDNVVFTQSVSTPLQRGIRFLRHPLPTPPSFDIPDNPCYLFCLLTLQRGRNMGLPCSV
jgi:hypothetical protein